MMLIAVDLKSSPIHGLGLFAITDIPKGTVLWRREPGFDLQFTQEQVDKLPKLTQDYIYTYACTDKDGTMWLWPDNAKFWNHSDDPNTGDIDLTTIALKDIKAGEELTIDYRLICEHPFYGFNEVPK
jgi:SET domain-containing protein